MNPPTTVTLTSSNSSNLIVSKPIVSESINVHDINVSTDVYINHAIYTPVGSILTFAGTSVPTGWLFCDGSEVAKSAYPRLFSVIGNLYGTPAIASNFVLPNLADRVPVGKTVSNSVGNSGGNSSITLTTNQLPAHTHTGTSDVSGQHLHVGTTDANGTHSHTGTSDANGTHSHSINDPGHTHTQWTINDDFNGSRGGNPPGFADDSAGYRTWNNINIAYTGISVNSSGSHAHGFTTDNGGSHAHTFTTENGGNHAHTFTTNSTGSGNSIDIRNKYIVINYIIRY
jgi:microcystin-dependent protein